MNLNKKLSEMRNMFDFDGHDISVLGKSEEIYYSPEQKEKFKIQDEELEIELKGKMVHETLSTFDYDYFNKMKYLLDEIKRINIDDKKRVVFLKNGLTNEVIDYDFEVHITGKSLNYKVKEYPETIFVIESICHYFV